MKTFHASLLALALLGCGSTEEPAIDASSVDAQVADASGPEDASSSEDASSPEDASTPEDASSEDASVADASQPDANVGEDAGEPPSDGSCDARRVTCRTLPPDCAENEAPSVIGTCWGPCVLAMTCTCSNTEECPIVPGFSEICYPGRGQCGPVL